MAINLATKYSQKVVDKFYVDSVVLGKTSKAYDWDGVESIKVWTIKTYQPNDYHKPVTSGGGLSPANPTEGSNTNLGSYLGRYGETYEVEDTIQTMTLTQDKAVSLAVDKGNNTEEMLIKNAGKVMSLEMREQFIPMFDKYCLGVWSEKAMTNGCYTEIAAASITKSNIVDEIFKHATMIRNAGATLDDAYCYIGETNFAKLLMADEFIHYANPTFTPRNIEKGVMGKVRGMQIVPVPDSYMPANVNFLTVKSSCVLAPTKIKDMKVHQDPPGLSGALLEIRWLFDAFMLDTRKEGVVVCLKDDYSA